MMWWCVWNTHRSLLYNWWRQRWARGRGNTGSRYTIHSARRAAAVWRCQSHRASAQPSPDRAEDSAAWYHDGKCPASGCRPNFWTVDTCRAIIGRKSRKRQVSVESTKMECRRSVLTRIKLIGIVCLVLAYWRATLYTVSGIYSRTKFKNTSSRCNGGGGAQKRID